MTEIITRRSVCPYDCPDACGLLVKVTNGKATGVTGDPDHPFTRGFLCAKMNRYEETVHSPRRLTTPLVRTGAKGSGEFVPISWQEAIAVISEKWQAIIEQYGAEAILPYSYAGTMGLVQRNAGHPFFHRLGASRLDRTICSPAKDAGIKAVLGDTPAPHPDEAADSDLVILWGINAAATSVHFLHPVHEAKKKGAKVWVVDAYQTPTTAVADELFIVKPGSDGVLALGMMHIIVRDGLQDRDFIDSHVQGFDELAARILPDYPPQRVAELTGLTVETIETMSAAYARAAAPFIRLGSGLSRYGNGSMTIRTIACLPALTGAYKNKGAGLFGGTSTGGAFAMSEILREDFMPYHTRVVNMNRLGHALKELNDPPVMSLYVYHSNPAAITPDQNAVLQGLSRDDLFTVVHERFLTDTARYADIVLPATSSLEQADIYRSYGTYCIQRAQAVIPPIGESKSNWEVFSLLAEALDFREPLFGMSADQVIDRLLELPTRLREGIDAAALAEGRAVELSPDLSRSGYATPSGKIELLNPREEEPLPRFLETHEGKGKYPFRLMTAPNLYSLNASFYERDDLRKKQQGMKLMMNDQDARERALADGEVVTAWNDLGEVDFILEVTEKVPPGVVVAEGVWWLEFAPGKRSVNALTSQRLTDRGNGSTFYDNCVEVRKRGEV